MYYIIIYNILIVRHLNCNRKYHCIEKIYIIIPTNKYIIFYV